MPNLPMPEGLNTTDLECVMLDIPSLDIIEAYGEDLDSDDFFYGDIPELKYAQGPVAEDNPHVTVLFGIHPSESYPENAEGKLAGWVPEPILIDHVGFFPSTIEGQDYKVIVGHVVPSVNLLVARKRLEELDHTDRFPEYKPHVTLAYITGEADVDEWVRRMGAAFGKSVHEVTAVNYGGDE